MIYRPGASALHAARPAAALAYCAALVCFALCAAHPIALGGGLLAVLLAGSLAGVGAELRRAALWWGTVALLFAALNPLIYQGGLTVIARLPWLPLIGQRDITLEACVAGALLGLRLAVVGLAFALFAAAVDPDELLRSLRRRSLHSALAATLATRLWPVLRGDSSRLGEAQRCLAGGDPPSRRERLLILRAVTTGALERAVDVAATLELRGYAGASRPQRAREPWSRHDLAIAGAALAIAGIAAALAATGAASFDAYPRLVAGSVAQAALAALAVVVFAVAPFAQRRGIAR
jgi:energy-coupling factor transport system permease protein